MKKQLAAATFLGSVAVAAVGGSQFNPTPGTETGDWYEGLEKSSLNPPKEVFAPVWTTLYAAMALSGYRIWSARRGKARTATLRLWFAQLGVNAAWSPLFFGAKQPVLSLIDLTALVGLQAAYMNKARKVDAIAAWLFVPYVAWVGFAGFLNAEVVRRNRSAGTEA